MTTPPDPKPEDLRSVQARHGVAAGRDIRDSTINIVNSSVAPPGSKGDLKNNVKSFASSDECKEMMLRDVGIWKREPKDIASGYLIISCILFAISTAYFLWFPELSGLWWSLCFLLFLVVPIWLGIAFFIPGLFQLFRKGPMVEKKCIGVVETRNKDADDWSKEILWMNAENDKGSFDVHGFQKEKIFAGDVGIAIFHKDKGFVDFWRSKNFSI